MKTALYTLWVAALLVGPGSRADTLGAVLLFSGALLPPLVWVIVAHAATAWPDWMQYDGARRRDR